MVFWRYQLDGAHGRLGIDQPLQHATDLVTFQSSLQAGSQGYVDVREPARAVFGKGLAAKHAAL